MREKAIEQYLCQRVKAIGGYAMKITSPGLAGVPDRLVLHEGDAYFVELKSPTGKPTERQKAVHRVLEAFGFPVTVINSKEGVDRFTNEIFVLSAFKTRNSVEFQMEAALRSLQVEELMNGAVSTASVSEDRREVDC